jgi:hypothetical protein
MLIEKAYAKVGIAVVALTLKLTLMLVPVSLSMYVAGARLLRGDAARHAGEDAAGPDGLEPCVCVCVCN